MEAINYIALGLSSATNDVKQIEITTEEALKDGLDLDECKSIDTDGDGAITEEEFKKAFNDDTNYETYWKMYKEACNLSSTTNSSGNTVTTQKTSNGYIITSTYDTSGILTGYTEKRTTSAGTEVTYEYTVSNGTKSLSKVTSAYTDGSVKTSIYENGRLSYSEKTNSSGELVNSNYDLSTVLKLKYPNLSDSDIEYVCSQIVSNTLTVKSDSIISYDVTTNKTGIDKIIAKYIDSDGNVIVKNSSNTSSSVDTEETKTSENEAADGDYTVKTDEDGTIRYYNASGTEIKNVVTSSNGTSTTTTYDESGNIISIENNNSSGELKTGYYTLETILQLKYPQLSSSEIAAVCEKITSNSYTINTASKISYNPLSNKTGIDKILAKYVNEDGSIIEN